MTEFQPAGTVAVTLALLSGLVIFQRRFVWLLGRNGPALAPAFLVMVWFAFLMVGTVTGSAA